MPGAAIGGLALCLLLAACSSSPPRPNGTQAAIRGVLQAQADAWNRGDIAGFMQGYWNDPALRFASADRVTYGWQPALDHYRDRYPDRAAMGTLAFSQLEIEVLAADAAVVFGRWSLQRSTDTPHGLFTLVFRKTPEGWKITRDHTSAAP
jgi:ketosteroid isomerase-like protein